MSQQHGGVRGSSQLLGTASRWNRRRAAGNGEEGMTNCRVCTSQWGGGAAVCSGGEVTRTPRTRQGKLLSEDGSIMLGR